MSLIELSVACGVFKHLCVVDFKEFIRGEC